MFVLNDVGLQKANLPIPKNIDSKSYVYYKTKNNNKPLINYIV